MKYACIRAASGLELIATLPIRVNDVSSIITVGVLVTGASRAKDAGLCVVLTRMFVCLLLNLRCTVNFV